MKKSPYKLLCFIIIFIIAAGFIGTFYIDNSKITFNNQSIESFDHTTVQLNTSISEFFSTFENALDMFSQNEMIQNLSSNPKKYYLTTMQLFKAFQESYSSTAFAYFAPSKIILGNKKLVTWPDTSEALANTNWIASKRQWYINAVNKNGKIAWTKPYLDATTKKPIITISKMIKDSNNQFKGVMAIDFFLDELSNKIENFKAMKQGYAFVIDKDKKNYIIISKDMKDNKFDKIIESNWLKSIFEKKSGNLIINQNNINYYVTFTTNHITKWKILGIIEEEKLYKPTRDIIKKIFIISLIIIAIGTISIIYIFQQMTKSINALSHSLGSTTNHPTIHTNSHDILSNEFNALLSENETFENLIDPSSSCMGLLFDSECELEKLMDILNHKLKENPTIDIFNELEIIISKLVYFENEFDNSSFKLHQVQKENIENHMQLLLNKINKLSKNTNDSKTAEILYNIEKKLKSD